MSRRRNSVRPVPEAGDWVLIGHGIFDPTHWWTSAVEWSAPDGVLVRDRAGWRPTNAPYLLPAEAIVTFGTREHVLAVLSAAQDAYHQHIPAIRDANVQGETAKSAAARAVAEAVNSALANRAGAA